MPGWMPILDGADRDEALVVIHDIAAALTAYEPELPGVSRGAAGIAVFFSYYGAALDDEAAYGRATSILERAARMTASRFDDVTLFSGIAGVAWTVELLAGVEPGSDDDPNDAVDVLIETRLANATWQGDFDLVSGLVGLAVYALARLPRPRARRCLESIVTHLDRLATHTPSGITWFTPPERLPESLKTQLPNGCFNLGMAHGVPAVASVLSRALAVGLEPARSLLLPAVEWLLAQRRHGEDASFQSWVAQPAGEQRSRSAWCYGDPGVAAALFCAARAAQQPEWETIALQLARAATRRDASRTGVTGSGLCHGAFGLAHIFARFFQVTGDLEFRAAARTWIRHGLTVLRDRLPREHDPTTTGLLHGIAGSGLVLMSACLDFEPTWDEVLLIDLT